MCASIRFKCALYISLCMWVRRAHFNHTDVNADIPAPRNNTELNRSGREEWVRDKGVCKSKSAKLSRHSKRSWHPHHMYMSINKQAVVLWGSSQYVQENPSLVQAGVHWSLSAVIQTVCSVFTTGIQAWEWQTVRQCLSNISDIEGCKKAFFFCCNIYFFSHKDSKLCCHWMKLKNLFLSCPDTYFQEDVSGEWAKGLDINHSLMMS